MQFGPGEYQVHKKMEGKQAHRVLLSIVCYDLAASFAIHLVARACHAQTVCSDPGEVATKLDHNVISFDKHQIFDAVVMVVHLSGKAEPIGLGAAELLLKHSLTTIPLKRYIPTKYSFPLICSP